MVEQTVRRNDTEPMEREVSRGINEAGRDSIPGRMGGAVSDTMNTVGSVGGGAVGVTRDVLKHVILATEDVGTGLVGGARHIATDVVHGVGDVGATAVHTMTDLLVGIVGGMKTVVGEAMPRTRRESQDITEARRRAAETEQQM